MVIPVLLALGFLGIYISIWFILLFLEKEREFHKKYTLKKFPKISVLIPAHNEEKIISKTLSSLFMIDYPKEKLEIIVIDDGSVDNTYEAVRKFARRGVRVFRKKQGGKANALNYGLKKVRNSLVLTLDADCFLARDALKKMVAEIEDENVMAVIPSIEVLNPRGVLEKIQNVEYSFMNFFRKLTASVYALSTAPAAVLYKTKFFRKYSGFDEKTLTEDFEMGLRIVSKKLVVAHSFESKVFTIVPRKLDGLMRQRVRWAYGSLSDLGKYKRLLGFKYGDLGAFILPQIPVYAGILIIVLFLAIFSTLQQVMSSLQALGLVGYDATAFLQLKSFYPFDTITCVFYAMMLIALLNYFLVRRTRRENISFFYFLAFIFIYSWLLSFFELIAVFHLLVGRKPRW